jgi:hypothetical protein
LEGGSWEEWRGSGDSGRRIGGVLRLFIVGDSGDILVVDDGERSYEMIRGL